MSEATQPKFRPTAPSVIVGSIAATGGAPRVMGQSPPQRPPVRAGIERAEFPLTDGIAVIEMPGELSAADYEDFEAWLQLVLRKVKRSVRPAN